MVNENKAICFDCLQVMVKKHANLEFKHPVVGNYITPGVIHYACDGCGNRIIPPHEAKRMEEQGVILHLIRYLKNNGAQPYQKIKAQMLCDETLLRSVMYKLKDKGKITVKKTGELEILEATPKAEEPIKLSLWEKIKHFFKRI